MKAFKKGLATGLILQLALGPVFFFIMNLTLQKSVSDGIAGVLAVTIVDYLYITLAILGIGKLLENKKIKKPFGIISSIVLVFFGLTIIGSIGREMTPTLTTGSTNLFSSFWSVFLLTISSPMTIVFFTSLFTAKMVEHNYTNSDLLLFGFGTGLATFLFMGISVLLLALIRGNVPTQLVQILNLIVGCLLVGYGVTRAVKSLQDKG